MRSLAHELGEALGCGGYLSQLVRTRSGQFRVEDGATLEDLEESGLVPASTSGGLRPAGLQERHSAPFCGAADTAWPRGEPGAQLRLCGYMERYRAYTSDGRFLAVLRYNKPENLWTPSLVFQLNEPSPYCPVSNSP